MDIPHLQKQLWLQTSESFKSDLFTLIYKFLKMLRGNAINVKKGFQSSRRHYFALLSLILFGGCDISTAPCPSSSVKVYGPDSELS